MGTHPNGPSSAVVSGQALSDWIKDHPSALGEKVKTQFGDGSLPFLLKVLSVRTALSIQSHPDKELAQKLHAERPTVYKDPNHKPEMAIALTHFEALCGFVSHSELVEVLSSCLELQHCLGSKASVDLLHKGADKKGLKIIFTALMTCDSEIVAEAVLELCARLNHDAKSRALTPKEELVLQLNNQYPKDVGVLAAYFLNLVKLNPGQAIYLAANEPHAYIAGEIVECMATSDNVVRAGLTPKLRDTQVLCESLTYNQGMPEVLEGKDIGEFIKCYSPPFDEFEVNTISIPAGSHTQLPINEGPVMLLVQRGYGNAVATCEMNDPALEKDTALKRGDIFFIPAGTHVDVSVFQDEHLVMWSASCNASVFQSQKHQKGDDGTTTTMSQPVESAI